MSNYTKTTNFAAKDSLPSGNAAKIVKGTEIDTEFNNIETASATKADSNNSTLTGTTAFETLSDGSISITAFVDEDNMASDSATLLPTQQSVKAYVDSQVTAQDLDFQADTGGALSIDLDSETLTFTGGTGIDTSGALNAVTFAIDSTVATLTGSQTLSNKTLATPVVSGNLTTDGLIDGRDVATDGTKLDGIESGATADQTAAEIKTAYESNADTNAFTDADHSKLDGIEASADVTDTANVTAAGALMDSELTSEASVKAMNQGVATTDSPTFAGVTAPITGNVTGNLTGNVTGNVTGNLTGDVTGDVTGNVTGNLTGSVLTAAQTSITSVGQLTSLEVANDFTAGAASLFGSGVLKVDSTTNRVGIVNGSPDVTLDIGSATDAVHVPTGTTAQRPTGAAGYFRYNSTLSQFEGYTDAWGAIGGGGGSNLVVDTMTGDGSDTTLTLSNDPLNENNTQVYIDGVYQNKDTYSVSGTTLTFSTAPPSGSAVEAMTIQPTAVNIPADASVTSAKLSGDLVTPGALDVTGSVTADGVTLALGSVINFSDRGNLTHNASTYDMTFNTNSLANALVIKGTGNVGIGTSSPANPLEIQHSTVGTGNGSNNTLALRYNSTTLYGQHYMDANGFYHIRADAQGVSGGNLVLGADNTVQIWSGSTPTERMRIDSSGRVAIGHSSPSAGLDVAYGSAGTIAAEFKNASGFGISITPQVGGSGAVTQIGLASGESLSFAPNNAEAMRIDSSGKTTVTGASTAGFVTPFVVKNPSTNAASSVKLEFDGGGTSWGGIGASYNTNNPYMAFFVGSGATAERMRIDSSGNLLVGTTSSSAKITVDNAGATTTTLLSLKDSGGTGTHTQISFNNTNGQVGTINTSGSATTYNTSSDQRLKENIVDAPSASDDIDAIQVRSFDWKVDGSHQKYGVVAQELQSVAPEAVSAPEDPDEMMGVDYSKLVPMMIKEIQSLRREVAALKENN